MGARLGHPLEAPQQLSSVDANMSADNAESLRPDIAAAAPLYAVWARDRLSGGPGVAGRTIAASADLSTSITVNPTNPSPGRAGLHPADDMSVSVTYGNTGIGTVDAQLSLDLAHFQITSVDYQGVVGPTPTSTATPGVLAVSGLGPGDGGTAVFHGTLTSGTEGQTLTATSDITTTTAVADPPLNNSDATTLTVDYPPVVEGISRLDANPTNAASLRWQVSFDQPVSGVNAADFTLVTTGTAAGTVQSSTCSGATCTVTTSITGEGTIALRVPVSATIQDGSGKPLATGNLPFVGPEYTVDRTPPTVTVSTTATNPTNADPIDFTVTFSETVQRPTSGSLTVSGGTISGISPGGSASTYTVSVIPDGDGSVSLGVPAGATTDLAGNPNTAGAAVTTVSDTTRPTLTLTAPSTPQNGPFTVSVDASEPVTGLTASDFGVAGGSVTGLTGPTSASTGPWTLTITPTTEGTVTITAPAGSASDSAGNTNPVATTDVTYDATRPSVSVDSAAGNPTGTSPVPFTLTFSEPVTGLSLSDLSITGGTATLAGSGRHYTVSLTPAGEGDVSVAVPAGVATDAAGNTNTAGAQVTRTYDVTGPAATITTTSASPTGTATFPVTVTWDEPVSDFGAGDVTVSNGSVSAFSGSGATYTFDVTATADGDVSVAIPAGGVHDAATNPNPAATPLVVTVDTTKPTVTLTAPATDPTNAADVMVSVTFSEPVTGFALGDLVLVNATATDLNGSGAAYTVMVHPQGQGDFSVRVPADAAVDTSDNPSQASNLLTRTYDTVATADLTYSGPSLTNAAEHMTLTLSDPAPIVPSDFTLTNATVTVSGGPSSYDVVVTPIADGEVSVQLPAGAFTDAAGNLSEASPTQSFTFDATPPTVVSWSQPSIANDTFTVSVSMSEPVAALDPGLITVTNGQVVGQVNGAGTDWTFSVAGTADGPVDVDLATGAAYDAAGNPSVAFGPRTTTYDATSPTVSITSPTAAVVTTSPIPVEILFSEAVTGFDASDIYATNATITNFSGAGRRFTVDVVPSADGQVEVWVPALAAADLASNPSLASNTLVREYDSQRPTVALTTPVTNPTNVSSVPVQAQFSKAVLGFAESDLVTTNATVSGFTQVDSRTWTFVLTPISDGEVRVEIPEASSASAGGNLSFGGSLAVTVDRVAPTLELTGPASPTVNAPVRFTLTSSEPLSDLTAGDVVIGGSAAPTAATLTPVDATHWRIVVTGMTDAGTVRVRIPAGSASDAAGNATVRVEETAEWLPEATFRLLQAPGTRYANRISLPVQVLGEGRVTFSATSSNESLLPASRISLVGTGTQRTLVLDGRDVDGRSTVVLKVDIGTVTKRVTLTFITGNPGTSDIVGTDGIDVMLGRRGNDVIRALDGADHIYGGRGGDELGGGPGRDVLVGGDGGDRLRGGLGADAFVLMPRDTALDFDPATGDFKVSPAAAARSWFGI